MFIASAPVLLRKQEIKVINLKYGFLESRKGVSRFNLEASRISLGWGWGMSIRDNLIFRFRLSRSRFEIPVF